MATTPYNEQDKENNHVKSYTRLDNGVIARNNVSFNSAGTILSNGLDLPSYDYISVAYPVNTTEVYTFKVGGSGGSTVATVTIVYTDSTKENISSVTKS